MNQKFILNQPVQSVVLQQLLLSAPFPSLMILGLCAAGKMLPFDGVPLQLSGDRRFVPPQHFCYFADAIPLC